MELLAEVDLRFGVVGEVALVLHDLEAQVVERAAHVVELVLRLHDDFIDGTTGKTWSAKGVKAGDIVSVRVLDVDVLGYVLSLQAAAPALCAAHGSAILTLSDAAAAKYRSAALAVPWERIKAKSPANYDQLRSKFLRE